MDTVYAVLTTCVGFGAVYMAACALGWFYVESDIYRQATTLAYMRRQRAIIAQLRAQKTTSTYKRNGDDTKR